MQAVHDGEEFSVIDWIVLLGWREFLAVETNWPSWARCFFPTGEEDRGVVLIEYSTCCNL